MEHQQDSRCSSPSSTGSFDSCSDLIGSLRTSVNDLANHVSQPEEKDQEKVEHGLLDDSPLNDSSDFQKSVENISSSEVGITVCSDDEAGISRMDADNADQGFQNLANGMSGETMSQGDSKPSVGFVSPEVGTARYGQAHLTVGENVLNSISAGEVKINEDGIQSFTDSATNPISIRQPSLPVSDIENKSCHDADVLYRIEPDLDLKKLEDSIRAFNVHNLGPSCLGSLSGGGGSSDIVQVSSKDVKTYGRSMSSSDMIKKEILVAGQQLKSGVEPDLLDHEDASQTFEKDSPYYGNGLLLDPEYAMKLHQNDRSYSFQNGAQTMASSVCIQSKETRLQHSLDCEEIRSACVADQASLKTTAGKRNPRIISIQNRSDEPVKWGSEDLGPDELFRYLEVLDVNESYVDTILGTEDSCPSTDGSRGRLPRSTSSSHIGTQSSSIDGSMTSTSRFNIQHTLSLKDIPFTVDGVEVVGASQRRGSSVWERMVGVKDHTVYCIKVVSGKHQWEVFRRYRDFMDFYHQLKQIFNSQTGTILPPAIEELGSESRRAFGNISPNVVEVRSFRIEKCLQSLLQAGPPLSTTPPLYWFLQPPVTALTNTGFDDHQLVTEASSFEKGLDLQLGAVDSSQPQYPQQEISKLDMDQEPNPFRFGKTIKLILNIHSNKSIQQLLDTQHYSCAGCYKHLDLEKRMIQGFAQKLGRGKPRLCEYTGQLFCSFCHLNELAVLPACVLRQWDFSPRRVSQLAKSYLDSIYDQPLLSVTAINSYLYSRVPILSHVKETRTKISRVLSCIRCPFHSRIQQIMGSRRYLLENNDFFALRELEDVSKGAFAVLPGLLVAILENLKAHVTKQCSVCQDTGEWCGAGILCEDPFHPIFPFQEDSVVNCKMCNAPFHQKCFLKSSSCPSCPKDWLNNKSAESSEVGTRLSAYDHTEISTASVSEETELGHSTIEAVTTPKKKKWLSYRFKTPKEALFYPISEVSSA